MHLQPGDDAPRFDMVDAFGNQIRLEDYVGQKILLGFHRFSTCPLCNLRTDQLAQYAPIWEGKGLKIITFYTSSAEAIQRYVGRRQPPFPVIADPEKAIYSKYNVESSALRAALGIGPWNPKALRALIKGYKPPSGTIDGDANLIPADFLLNPDLTIHTAHYGKSGADHLPIRSIVRFLEKEVPAQTAV